MSGQARHDTQGAGRLSVRLSAAAPSETEPRAGGSEMDMETLAALVRNGSIVRHLLGYRAVEGRVDRLSAMPRPLALSLLLRLLSRGPCTLVDARGAVRPVGWASLVPLAGRCLRDMAGWRGLVTAVGRDLDVLERLSVGPPRVVPDWPPQPGSGPPLHVRTDLWQGVATGGAIAHTAGIVNAMVQAGAPAGVRPVVVAFDRNPILDAAAEEQVLGLPERFWDLPEAPQIAANRDVVAQVSGLAGRLRAPFIYHRYAAYSYGVALAARRLAVPLVLEYNGSEVWIARHWGRPLRHEALAQRIEAAVLAAADRIVTVSQPLTDDLVARGVPPDRIVTEPNGVDCRRFHPARDGGPVRRRLGLPDAVPVIGFIGTFSAWHGVPVLVEAFAQLAAARTSDVRLLLIGDGPERGAVMRRVAEAGLADRVVLTGAVPQGEAPAYLAAADVLVAPHVPNPDGTTFFGSPTKLFEYMAMGRPIVASALGQIGQVLVDGRTAVLVAPGHVPALAQGLASVLDSPALSTGLGAAARQTAVEKHDWTQVVSRVLSGHA